MWHRQNWSILHPYVHLEEDELDDLRSGPAFVAGFVDDAVESNTDLYDVFVNLSTEEINVATHAKGNHTVYREYISRRRLCEWMAMIFLNNTGLCSVIFNNIDYYKNLDKNVELRSLCYHLKSFWALICK